MRLPPPTVENPWVMDDGTVITKLGLNPPSTGVFRAYYDSRRARDMGMGDILDARSDGILTHSEAADFIKQIRILRRLKLSKSRRGAI